MAALITQLSDVAESDFGDGLCIGGKYLDLKYSQTKTNDYSNLIN